ncbi:MAG: envelope stress response membrane protein PspC [Sphingomonas sp.]|nr:envelope stress response membrane protein PspC [Sphingomonas sp.]
MARSPHHEGPPRHTKFYRDKKNAKFLGVCAGIADYTGFDVALVRLGMVMTFLIPGSPTILFYLLAGFFVPDRPYELEGQTADEQKFWQGVRASPRKSARQIHSQFRDIDRRLADIESFVTSENRVLAQQIDDLK